MTAEFVTTDRARPAWAPPLWPWGFLAVGTASIAILAAPLAAYLVLIAAFGLPHVLCELRYVDERFSARLPRRALAAVGALLMLLIATRLLQFFVGLPGALAIRIELALGAALSVSAAMLMQRWRVLGFITGAAIATGIALAPVWTFLFFAWAHNLTPLAFVAEAAPRGQKLRAAALLTLPFFVWPALIATGAPQDWLREITGHVAASAPSLFGAGREPLSAFLPRDAAYEQTLPLFTAAVAAQAMHYFAVIVVLPRLLRERGGGQPLVAWPRWGWFYAALAGVSALVFASYALSFAQARAYYGIAAAVHSWIELPVFLLALGGLGTVATARR